MRPSWRYVVRAATLLAVATAGTVALTGCESFPAAIFRPQSPGAEAVHNLGILLLVLGGIVLVGVEATLIAAVLLFRNRPEESAVQTHGNLKLETGWTVATAVVIFFILGLTVKTMADVTAIPAGTPNMPLASAFPGDTIPLRVVGHQWWWTFQYPDINVITANEVHVPVGRTIKLQLEADDVVHSFWAPQLGGKTDTVPGQVNYSSFLATRPGVYEGLCAEFCGVQHAHMGFKIVAEPAADFSNWVRAQQAPAANPTSAEQREGQAAFQRACAACHTVRGTAATGVVGPDLTHFGSRLALAANTLENTPQNLARWLRDPSEVKPGNKMPNLRLEQGTIDQMVAYLESLK